jgi:nicotinate dehydrogenase subunit A
MPKAISLHVNGRATRVTVDDPDMPLLYVLRDNLGLHGPRFGCGLGQCGSCTVHLDGRSVRSCVTPLSAVGKKKIVTLEGLGTLAKLHPVQKAFIEEQAAQCGYCINGMIMEAAAFLATNKRPSETQIKQALANNLCRCGTHLRIVRAVKRAAAGM